VDEPDAVRLGQRARNLLQHVRDALGWLRPIELDDRLERRAIEKLHRVVEDAVRCPTVVEDRDGVRMGEACGELHLALEAQKLRLARVLGEQELDRRGPAEHRVARPVHHAHAAFADLLLERVLAELTRRTCLPSQPVDHARGGCSERDGHRPPSARDRRGNPPARGWRSSAACRSRAVRQKHADDQRHTDDEGEDQRAPCGAGYVDRAR